LLQYCYCRTEEEVVAVMLQEPPRIVAPTTRRASMSKIGQIDQLLITLQHVGIYPDICRNLYILQVYFTHRGIRIIPTHNKGLVG